MFDMASTDLKLADYIQITNPELHTDNEVIAAICSEVRKYKDSVSNKDIILCLIRKIESETDEAQQDRYLQALEYIVYNTPDDME
ncbi:biofilm development regulator YmgB/AriR family protein [Rouxiella chamberiensis]|uniref:Biofilm development regulator YmgB/AriR family protein n=2 Tax=Rouxiella chamberiensis TaxID=1513468 RepID=A0ABY7HPZ2_9GAMM|nr:biofilm development regulator YmgB/AriR family protein [Rouxiella chamberiensis]WAT01092.1 biofilm development regulator YmgB/AriR family protein [Rouxiella chamberiensis]